MNLKNQKGITMVAEVITIVIFMLLIGTITYSSMSSFEVRELNSMYADVLAIQEKAINYYLKNGEAPINESKKIDVHTLPTTLIRNPNDGEEDYYVVDLTKLLNLSLNNKQTEDAYYIINAKTLTVYYSEGVEIKGLLTMTEETPGNNLYNEGKEVYHTIPSNYENVQRIDVEKFR